MATSSDCSETDPHILQCTGRQKTVEERGGGRRRHGQAPSKRLAWSPPDRQMETSRRPMLREKQAELSLSKAARVIADATSNSVASARRCVPIPSRTTIGVHGSSLIKVFGDCINILQPQNGRLFYTGNRLPHMADSCRLMRP